MRRPIIGAVIVVLAGVVGSSQVIDPKQVTGDDVVGLRKTVMMSMNAQYGALRGAVASRDLAAVKAAGLAITALAGVLPILFENEHAELYPYGDSPIRYVAGDDALLLRNARVLQAAAQAAANATSIGDANVRAISASCAACHRTFQRGG